MIYLDWFTFPDEEVEFDFFMRQKRTCYDSFYPFQILSRHHFRRIDFAPVTILYGGNGTGKTTAINVIAENSGLIGTVRLIDPISSGIIWNGVTLKRASRSQVRAGLSQATMCLIIC